VPPRHRTPRTHPRRTHAIWSSKHAASHVKAFSATLSFFSDLGHPIANLISDDESSAKVKSFFRSSTPPCVVQFVAPNNHRANFAERCTRTTKNYIISTLASIHVTFPLDLWDGLLPLIELTLNHLQPWHPDPKLSACHGLHGLPFDFNAHPTRPAGELCCVLE
jgi:hypothetical protein